MEKIYECPFCGRNDFKRKGDLTQHIKRCKQNPNRVDMGDEHKRKISEALKGRKLSDTHRQKMGEAKKGKKLSDTHRQKISEALKGHITSDVTKQKMSETSKTRWEDPEERKKLSEANYRRWNDPEYRQRVSESMKKAYENPSVKQKRNEWLNSTEYKQKSYDTKKKNNSFNTSKIELELQEWFNSQNIDYKTQYKNSLYPFMCDFYLPKHDLYIEIQGTWTHGDEPFNPNNPEHIELLNTWKSKNSKFYDNAIETWTIRDVKKRNVAKQNNLNWIEIFSIDLEECVNIIQKHFKG